MSTRSNIIAKTKEGYKVIYCHSDGYPEWVGATLKKHYTKPEAVKWLFEKGDASSLGLPFRERKWEDDYDEERCLFYRSRGETGIDSQLVTKEYFESLGESWIEYLYFFDGFDWYGVTNIPRKYAGKKGEYEDAGLKTIEVDKLASVILG